MPLIIQKFNQILVLKYMEIKPFRYRKYASYCFLLKERSSCHLKFFVAILYIPWIKFYSTYGN